MFSWDSQALKNRAKAELKNSYKLSVVAVAVASVLGAGAQLGIYGALIGSFPQSNALEIAMRSGDFSRVLPAIKMVALLVLAVAFVLVMFSVLISLPIRVGLAGFFMNAPKGNRDFGVVFAPFRKGRYAKAARAMLLRDFYLALLFLAFFAPFFLLQGWSYFIQVRTLYDVALPAGILGASWLPGILSWGCYALMIPFVRKTLQWWFVPHIMAQFPDCGAREALKRSSQLTAGQKGKMFGFLLSFIGWFALGVLCLGVGIWFVEPYSGAAFAQLYYALRGEIIFDPSMVEPKVRYRKVGGVYYQYVELHQTR